MRLATEDARNVMWLPDVSVTNRKFKELEVISSSVKVWSDGRATKAMSRLPKHGFQVQRVLVTMTNDFDLKACLPCVESNITVAEMSHKCDDSRPIPLTSRPWRSL